MLDFIKKTDQFSVQFSLLIGKNQHEFKSYFGGLISILIYSSGIAYTIFYMYLWQSNQILPSVSQTIAVQNKFDYKLQKNQINLIFDTSNQSIDPFDKNEAILIPILYNYNYTTKIDEQVLTPTNQTLSIGDQDLSEFRYSILTIQLCINKSNVVCASQNKIDQYFKQINTNILKVSLQNFNSQTKSFDQYQSIIYFTIDQQYYSQNTVLLNSGLAQIDEGFIFATASYQTYLQKAQNYGQTLSLQNSITKYNSTTLLAFYLQMDSVQYRTQIQFPLLSQILAQVGSIFSLLMTVSIIVQQFNQSQLNKKLINEIISFYFPQYKKIKIKKRIFSNEIKILSLDGKIEYEPQEIIKIVDQASAIAYDKLNILNILYEISRIQFVLQSLQNRELIQQSKQIGIELPLKVKKSILQEPIEDSKEMKISNQTKKLKVLPKQYIEKNDQNIIKVEPDVISAQQDIKQLIGNLNTKDKIIENQQQFQFQTQSRLLYKDMNLFMIQDQDLNYDEIPEKLIDVESIQYYKLNRINLFDS